MTVEASQIGPCGGNGIVVSGGRGIGIYDSFVHPETRSPDCCDHNDGVLVESARNVTVWGNVIAYGESNVEHPGATPPSLSAGNFLLNPRGPYPRSERASLERNERYRPRQLHVSSTNVRRYKYPDDQEDSINFGLGSDFVAAGNYVTGGHSKSGCGLIADDGASDVSIVSNQIVNSGQCGIGIASGTGQLVRRNRVINRNPVRGGGNTAIYAWNQYASVPCGPVSVSVNVATEIRKDGTQSGFWDGGGCNPVTRRHNIWNGAAEKLLTPIATRLPPPPIPPVPKNCAIESPYTTQKSWPPC